MKKLILFFTLIIVAFNVYPQKNVVKKASKALENGELSEAMKLIDQAIAHKQTKLNSGAWELRGDVYYQVLYGLMPSREALHKHPGMETFEAYKKASELTNKSSTKERINKKLEKAKETLSNVGNMFLAMRSNDKALELYNVGLSISNHLNQSSGDVLTMIGNTYLRMNDYKQAAEVFIQAVDVGFGTEQTTLSALISLSLAKSPDYEKVMKKYRTAFPDYKELSTHELNYLISKGDYDRALPMLEERVVQYPDDVNYRVMLGSIQVSLDKDEAVDNLKKVLTIDSYNVAAHSDLGRYYLNKVVKLNRKIEELVDLKEVLRKEEERAVLLSKVSENYERVIELDPTNKLALRVLSDVYRMLGDSENLKRVRSKIKALEN